MKKFLFIHTINSDYILGNKEQTLNHCSNWMRCFDDWENTANAKHWNAVTVEECQDYEYVMFTLLPEENSDKLNRISTILNYSQRRYKTIVDIQDVVGWQMNPFSVQMKHLYLKVSRSADIVFHYGLPESEGYWTAITKGHKTININRPYPTQYVKNLNKADMVYARDYVDRFNLGNKSFIWVGKGLKNINEERNVFSSLVVAKKIQELTGWTIIVFTNMLKDDERKICYSGIFGIEKVIELPETSWYNYIKVLSLLGIKIAVHLDCLETRGQVALDSANLKIPLICSGSVAGHKLYPDTWLSHCRNVDKAVELSSELIEDNKFREKVVNYAYEKVEDYSTESTRRKLEQILNTTI